MPTLVESHEDITPSDTHLDHLLDIQGPITGALARQLNLEVSSFLSTSLYDLENIMLPNDYIVIGNHGEEEMLRERLRGVEDQQGRSDQGGGLNRFDFESISESRSSQH